MEIFKADWLCHLKDTRKGGGPSSIFSISVDATGRRLATAGLDSTIRVWNVEALTKPDEPRLLAAMTRHDGAVLCVKWSPAGAKHDDYLASGSDDSIVLIWKREKDGPGMAGAFEFDHERLGLNAPTEAYRVVHRLTEHTSDVAGLEWSPDGRWLASCGLDGLILIWEVEAGFRLAHRLEGHKGFVKGLAWDPLGVFLASQSDDHSLIVWRTRDWRAETILTRPFDQAHEETFFRRPSWSPDGRLLAAANAVNGMQPVVSLVVREEWRAEVAFVGHLLAVEVARFSPRLYHRDDDGSAAEAPPSYLCAAGSQDCNTSVWSDRRARPLAVLTDLFGHAVMDLEWLADGLRLLVAAYDGTVALVRFSAAFVGAPLGAGEQAAYLAQLRRSAPGDVSRLPTSVEQIELLAAEQAVVGMVDGSKEEEEEEEEEEGEEEEDGVAVVVRAKSLRMQPVQVQASTPTKQVEGRTREGKRRITPLLVQESVEQQQQPAAVPAALPAAATTAAVPAAAVCYSIRQLPEERLVLRLPAKPQPRLVATHEALTAEVRNGKGAAKVAFVADGSRILWEDRLDAPVLMMEACGGLLVLVLEDCTFVAVDFYGARRTPPLALDGHPVAMAMGRGTHALGLMLVVDSGAFKVWDLQRMALLRTGSLAALAKGAAIARLRLCMAEAETGEGGAFYFDVGFTDGRAYTYIPALDTCTQTNGPLFKALEYDGSEEAPDDPREAARLVRRLLAEDPDAQRRHSVAVLESRLAFAALAGLRKPFLLALNTYATRLLLEGLSLRFLALVNDLAHRRGAFHHTAAFMGPGELADVLGALRQLVVRSCGSGDARFEGIPDEIQMLIGDLPKQESIH